MKYTIISINDERKPYKDAIRLCTSLEEVRMRAVNAREVILKNEIAERGLELKPQWDNAKAGELGVWLSNYDRWKLASVMAEPLIVFEDDAMIDGSFDYRLNEFMSELPDDWDFAALWVPDNQRQDYLYNAVYDEAGNPRINGYLSPEDSIYRIQGNTFASLVYQGYGMVSLIYSPAGGKKLVSLAHERGIDGPVDCWLYQEAHKGNLKGFAPKPEHAYIVNYDWAAESHVQQTERLK